MPLAAADRLRVLVVDDDADTRANLRDILELDDYSVETAGSIAETLARTNWHEYAAIILDRRLPDGTADDVLPRLNRLAPYVSVIIVTGYADLQSALSALRLGAADYILKPINPEELRNRLERLAQIKRAQEKLHEQAALLDLSHDAIIVLDLEGRIRFWNEGARETYGWHPSEVMGQVAHQLLQTQFPTSFAATQACVLQTSHWEGDLVHARRDGMRITVNSRWALQKDAQGRPVAIMETNRDVTDATRAQEKLLQSERLAAIGQMVAGLTHESGNALARSQACLEMLALEVQDRPEALDLIARIQKAQDHLKQLYDEVRSYAAPLRLELDSWDLSFIWRQAWENVLALRQGKEAVLHETTAGIDLDCVVDSFRLEQVFRNIFENALAACSSPVRITIEAQDSRCQGRLALRLAVRDNGPGLSAEQQRRIFEPFFTTKTKGTGLGMAIAKRIIEAHGGQIAVGTCPGPGAEIVIMLLREDL